MLKLALCVAPIVGAACFSPAQALQLKTFTGFVDPLQSGNWTPSGTGNAQVGFKYNGATGTSESVMSLSTTAGTTPQKVAYTFNTANFNAYAPTSTTPGKYYVFDSGTLTYTPTFFSGAGPGVGFNFTPWPAGPQTLAANQTFKFELEALTSNSIAEISGLSVDAYYKEVPGPLPVAAALGAFAWSRRIRRRLSSAAQA